MPAGLEITNNSGQLVISSEAIGYRYLGQPTLSVSASKAIAYSSFYGVWYGTITPYSYTITLPSSGLFPLVGARLYSDKVVEILSTTVSGTTCTITAYSANQSGCTDLDTTTFSPPSLYVFCPFSNSDSTGYGLELYNSSGNLAFSTSWTPLNIKQIVSLPNANSNRAMYSGGVWGDSTFYYVGQSTTVSSYTTPIMINAVGNALWYGIKEGSSETIFNGSYGWRLSGTSLIRERYIESHEFRSEEINDELDATGYYVQPILIDGV